MNLPDRFLISPSILAGDFAKLGEEARRVEHAGADLLHVDVMDGNFVPNLTFGPSGVEALSRSTTLPLDVHLMIQHADKYIPDFLKAGSSILTIHVEALYLSNLQDTLKLIKSRDCLAGISLNPATPVSAIKPYLHLADLILVMSVVPGFGGQSFMPEVLHKVKELCTLRQTEGYHYKIEIDGGINFETLKLSKEAGIDIAVAGTFLFKAKDMAQTIAAMKAN